VFVFYKRTFEGVTLRLTSKQQTNKQTNKQTSKMNKQEKVILVEEDIANFKRWQPAGTTSVLLLL